MHEWYKESLIIANANQTRHQDSSFLPQQWEERYRIIYSERAITLDMP